MRSKSFGRSATAREREPTSFLAASPEALPRFFGACYDGGMRCTECADLQAERRIANEYYSAVVASLTALARGEFMRLEYQLLKASAEEARHDCVSARKAFRDHWESTHSREIIPAVTLL